MKKKEKGFNSKIILPLFVVFILVTSMFGYMWGSSRTRIDYNSFRFDQLENGNYILKLGNTRIAFNNFPANIEWINSTEGIGKMFSTPMAYITSDYNSSQAQAIAEISFSMAQLLDETKQIFIQNSFTAEGDHIIPVVTCRNATAFTPVIHIQKSNATEIIREGSCITVNAKNKQEMFMAYERLVYIILGVME